MTVAIFPDIIHRPPMRFTLSLLWFLALTSSLAPADPSWWAAQGVKSAAPAANMAPANMAPATIGQAKHMAAMALAELADHLDAPAFQALQTDLASIVDLTLPDLLPPGFHESQRAILLTGQLKAIAKPFYDHLRTHDATWLDNAMTVGNLVVMEPGSNPPTPSPYPWSEATTDDANRAPATLGQLKAVFSLPLEEFPVSTLDTDNDGMPDTWETHYGLNPNDPSDANTDADNDGSSNLQEYEAQSAPNNADSIPTDRDGDGLANENDAVPDDAEINWQKSRECRYVWIEQATSTSSGGGGPMAVNSRGQILFGYSIPHPPLYETLPEQTITSALWDSATSSWTPLENGGQGISGKVIEMVDLSDQGYVFGRSHAFNDYHPESPAVDMAGMIWKPSATSSTTYLAPTFFMPAAVPYISSGVDILGGVSNDGVLNCITSSSSTTGAWETYNGSSSSPNLTFISALGNEESVPGAIVDAATCLMLVKSYQPDSSWRLKLYDGGQVADVEGILPANNLGDYTPVTDINVVPSLKTNGQRRLWLSAHHYAGGAYHYPVRIEKRAGGSGAGRWHNPPSMAEGAWKLNGRGEAIKSSKVWRNGTYTDLNALTSMPAGVSITHAIDLASNGIILVLAEENGVDKTGILIPVEFKKMWETPNKANQIVVKARRDDPATSSQQSDAQDNLYGAPRNMLYITADPTDGKYHVSVDIAAGLRDQFVCAAYMLGNGNKISGSDTAFPTGDESADMLIPSTTGSQSGEYYEIKVAFDINKNGLIDGSETPIRLVALDTAHGLPAAPVVRGFSQGTVVAANFTIQGQVAGTGWTGWKPNWAGEWFVPNAIALERLFYDGEIGNMVQAYRPTETLSSESLDAFGTPGDFNEWLTHHAGSNFTADGVTTVQHYYWDTTTRISSLIANSSPMSLLKNNGTITAQMAGVTDSTVESFKLASVAVGQSQTFPPGARGYDLQTVLAGLGPPHSSPSWVPVQTLLIGDQDGYAGAIPDDAFGTVGRSRFINGEYRFIVKKEERTELTAYPDGSFTYTPYTAVVVYLRVNGSSLDLYDFNHNAGGLSEPAAIIQLGYGNGSYGRTNGVIYRTSVDILKDYEMKEIRLP